MLKTINIAAAALCGALIAGSALSTNAYADTASRTWVGPNGGSVHWRGDSAPDGYRGAVTVTTPDGDVYRRVTKGARGPDCAYVSRRWVGPDGAVVRRRGVRY
jgi:hypothetical protein